MAIKTRQLDFVIYPTDNRMTCKRYGFEWVVTTPNKDAISRTKDWFKLNRLHDLASKHIGRYTSFPLHDYDKRYGRMEEYRFAVRYNSPRLIKNNLLYFRTIEDVDHLMMLYALTHGMEK